VPDRFTVASLFVRVMNNCDAFFGRFLFTRVNIRRLIFFRKSRNDPQHANGNKNIT